MRTCSSLCVYAADGMDAKPAGLSAYLATWHLMFEEDDAVHGLESNRQMHLRAEGFAAEQLGAEHARKQQASFRCLVAEGSGGPVAPPV